MAETNTVIDISHHNGNVDFARAARAGITGVFQKATQGTGYTDPTYASNKAAAKAAGLNWGAYHFGTGSDGIQQARHFLTVAEPGHADLLVLDFEKNGQDSMTLDGARAFVTYIQMQTGRWPGLYAGSYIKQLLGDASDPILGQCWFWLAQYGTTATVPMNWGHWTFWQYTDGTNGPEPHSVDGVGRCDRDKFNGSAGTLAAFWNSGGA